ncbi:MAG: DUF3298 domain-containing protein [Candidatus Taylorbacteria bacterium]|nr:DUF3298 domain-containing protein [Candidatus Taylorbacteria bacterium]
MNTLLRIIGLIIIIGIVGGVLFYVMEPRSAAKSAITPIQTDRISTENADVQKCGAPLSVTIEKIDEQASSSPSVSVEYPQFPTLPEKFNQEIKSAVTSRLQEFRSIAKENTDARKATAAKNETPNASDFSFLARWEPVQVNNAYVSLIIRFDSYVGGANENQELQTFNFDIVNKQILALDGLFASSTDYLSVISTEARKQLLEKSKTISGDNTPTETLIDGTVPKTENFKNFTFTENSIQIYFPKYSVAAGAFGEQQIVIPFSSIEPGLSKLCQATN